MERILLAVDGSDHALRAAELAGELSRGLGVDVDIVHVMWKIVFGPASHTAKGEVDRVSRSSLDVMRAAGSSILEEATTRVRDAGGTVVSAELVVGDPAATIVSTAQDLGADCIVLGRRGLGDVRGLFMGSVSHRVGQLTDTTLVTTE